MLKYSHKALKSVLRLAILDLKILSGEESGMSDVGYKDVTQALSANLRHAADLLDSINEQTDPCLLVFPSVKELTG